MITLCICPYIFNYVILFIWVISIFIFWTIRKIFSKDIEDQARYFIYYTLIATIVLLLWKGDFFIDKDYLANITTEIAGIAITVFLIDRVYKYVTSKNEELYRKLSLKMCRMPIYTYCANWLYIFEPDNKKLEIELNKYDSLEDLFKSDDFYNRINSFDFNQLIDKNKTYAQYYNEKINDVTDRFQNILAKYASKLSYRDIQLLEHFGGRAYIFTVFAVMKFISETKFTHQHGSAPAQTIMPFNNSFKDIKKENFREHFNKLVEFINQYNQTVDNDYEKWTIKNISKLNTIKTANDNPTTEW
jgi:hypothetical protein